MMILTWATFCGSVVHDTIGYWSSSQIQNEDNYFKVINRIVVLLQYHNGKWIEVKYYITKALDFASSDWWLSCVLLIFFCSLASLSWRSVFCTINFALHSSNSLSLTLYKKIITAFMCTYNIQAHVNLTKTSALASIFLSSKSKLTM